MSPVSPRSPRTLLRLKRQLHRRRITQDQIAWEARVHRTMVNHVLNGRARSRHVMAAIETLLGERGES